MVVDRGGSTRYHLLETIRQYARDKLVAADETTELRNRHLAFFLRLALEAEPQPISRDLAAWLTRLDADAGNMRAAVDWAFDEDPDAALRLCVALSLYWRARSLTEGLDHLRRAADACPTDSPTRSGGRQGARVAGGAHPGGRGERILDGGERVDRTPLGTGGPRDRARSWTTRRPSGRR